MILVVFLFLRNVRATLIPSVAVPVSLIGTFGVMYLCNYSIDNLSLMALTISTGFVVDDAIVVIENITRYLEQGMTPMEAALKGAQEIGFTVLSISISLVAVFIPILLMGGIVGRLFREFAVTLSVAILVSLRVSLTTTPMMCSRLLKNHDERKTRGCVYRPARKSSTAMLGFYERTLLGAAALGAHACCFADYDLLNVFSSMLCPRAFSRSRTTAPSSAAFRRSQDISFQAMQDLTLHFVDIIKTDPAVQYVWRFTGGGGAVNTAVYVSGLKPLDERKISSSQVIDRLRPKLVSVPGATVFLQAGQDLRIGGRQSNAQYQYTIQSDNVDDLVAVGPASCSQK